jgi:hypothetical protein
MAPGGRPRPAHPVRVFCQEARRLGLPWPVHRRLTGCGVTPVQIVEPVDEDAWLDAAVEPTTGEAFWWEVPRLDADGLTAFCGSVASTLPRVVIWTTGDKPMAGAQRSYLKTLCDEASEPMDETLTKA